MKRIITLGLVLGLIAFAGCAPRTTPTPTATPLVSPAVTPHVTSNAGTTASPGMSPSAGVNAGGATPGVGANNENISIPNFREGTAVMMTDLPLIRNAFEEKYKDYEVIGVTHATHENEQLYRIEYKDASGKVEEAYIRPSGVWYDAAAPASNVD